MTRARQILPFLLVLTACYAVLLTWQSKAASVSRSTQDDAPPLIRADRLRGYLLGAEGLAADWYWIKALQHVGDKLAASESDYINLDDLRALNINQLYPYLDAATDLDPHFLAAYSYGAVVLPAINTEHAVAIAEKGIANNPQYWRLHQHLGYIHWRAGNYDAAAHAYSQGSKVDGAPSFMKLMAAVMQNDAGSRATARTIYQQMLEDKSDETISMIASARLSALDRLDVIDELDRQAALYQSSVGKCPERLQDLAPALSATAIARSTSLLRDRSGNFVDSTGRPYILDKATCTVIRSE